MDRKPLSFSKTEAPVKGRSPRVQVTRDGKPLGEYHPLQLGSLIETGHLEDGDLCFHTESAQWVPLKTLLESGAVPGFSRIVASESPSPPVEENLPEPARKPAWFPWFVALLAIAAASGMGIWAWRVSEEAADLKAAVARAESANSEWKKKYQNVLFSAREVATSDLVRGRIILRDKAGKRTSLPGIKVRLYPRAELAAYLSERYSRIGEAGGTDTVRLTTHFVSSLPPPVGTSTTDSDGRFEMKIPEPGEYVIQTSIRSQKSGEMRIWFVTFDSRDPLNTPVDITEANAVQQFNPLFMVIDGR